MPERETYFVSEVHEKRRPPIPLRALQKVPKVGSRAFIAAITDGNGLGPDGTDRTYARGDESVGVRVDADVRDRIIARMGFSLRQWREYVLAWERGRRLHRCTTGARPRVLVFWDEPADGRCPDAGCKGELGTRGRRKAATDGGNPAAAGGEKAAPSGGIRAFPSTPHRYSPKEEVGGVREVQEQHSNRIEVGVESNDPRVFADAGAAGYTDPGDTWDEESQRRWLEEDDEDAEPVEP